MSDGSNGPTYYLYFQNNSKNTWTAAVYQQLPDIDQQNVMTLAWFAQEVAPTTNISFKWQLDYDFVWSETGTLAPGVVFSASQTWSTDPAGQNNQVGFTCESGGAFSFTNQGPNSEQGTLYIVQDGTIPEDVASVGIAMYGASTFAVQAEPNITTSFTPTPTYWITFGENYMQGQVMDIQQITNPAQIVFPPNVYSMTATLSQENTWSVQPTSQVNAALLTARQHDPNARWGVMK